MTQTAIQIERVSKRYRIGLEEERSDTLAHAVARWVRAPLENFRRLRRMTDISEEEESDDLIWALRDVSLEVPKGEILGIIGPNGAGKTTLLKILSRITEPTSGRVVLNGRVSSLLEVGTGFHQELTGRENIYLNGTILGMRKAEVDHKLEEIVEFSGIPKFIDTPVKRYSAGMKVRLAFSVAAHLEPEILLVDEVLAVGDARFQRKCLGKMGDVAEEGRTVVLISHDMGAISSLCSRAVLLQEGEVSGVGSATAMIEQYLSDQVAFAEEESPGVRVDHGVLAAKNQEDFSFERIEVSNPQSPQLGPRTNDPLVFRFEYASRLDLESPGFMVRIKDTYGHELIRVSTMPISGYPIDQLHPRGRVELWVESIPFVSGDYFADVYLIHEQLGGVVVLDNVLTFHVQPKQVYDGKVVMDRSRGLIVAKHRWSHEPAPQPVGAEGEDGARSFA